MADDYVSLKCPNCGASNLNVDGDMVVCPYCGSRQAKVDAQKYVEQIKMEVMNFVSKAFPVGVNLNQTETMDVVARHNIFQQSVKPIIESLYNEYRFAFVSSVNQQLISVPYRVLSYQRSKYDTKQLFEFDEKIRTVASLAVDESSKELLSTASAVAMSYASLLNNMNLISSDSVDRYRFMVNNYRAAIDSLNGILEYSLVSKRFQGLLLACEGFDKLMHGNYAESRDKLRSATSLLDNVQAECSKNIDFGSMVYSIKRELIIIDTGLIIVDALSTAPNIDSNDALVVVKNFMEELNAQEERFGSFGGQWTTMIKRTERFNDIFSSFKEVVRAKTGESILRIAPGEGEFYVPMWIVELKYSFVTGMLFKKKAVKVDETLLVSAMFTTSKETFMTPSLSVTDIFANMPESKLMERVKGKEQSLTVGVCIKNLVDRSAIGPINASADIIVPVSTGLEAELLCKEYLELCKESLPKLTMGNPVVKGLVYVPCTISDGNLKLVADLGNFEPSEFGDLRAIVKLSI